MVVQQVSEGKKEKYQEELLSKKKKKSIKESLKKIGFLLPAYASLILFVFIPIGFSFLVSIFQNPTVLQLRNAFFYYTNLDNLSNIWLWDFFYADDPRNPGIFLVEGLVLLLITILTIVYIRYSYKKLKRFKKLKDNKIARFGVAFILGLAIGPITILLVAPLLIYSIDWVMRLLSFLTQTFIQVPLNEYREVLTDPDIDFMRILFNTLFWTLTCTGLHILLGIALAILLNREFIGRGLFRSLFILPWAVPSFVSTLMWRALVFDKDIGILGSNTELLGSSFAFTIGNLISLILSIIIVIVIFLYLNKYLSEKIQSSLRPIVLFLYVVGGFFLVFALNGFLSFLFQPLEFTIIGYKLIDIPQISSTFWYTDDVYIFGPQNVGMRLKMITFSAILVNVWLGVPFMMLSFLATLQSIPKELYEAAKIDGLTEGAQFRKITLPLLKPTLLTVSLLGIIWTFNLFNVVYILAQNQTGLGNAIYYDIFVTFIYNRFSQNEYSEASALAFTVFIILISFSLVYRRLIKTEKLFEE